MGFRYTDGLFTGGFGLHYGVEKVGAAVIPAASGNTARQLMLMQDLGTNALVCTPSYALNLADVANSMSINVSDMPLKYAQILVSAGKMTSLLPLITLFSTQMRES